MSWGTKHNFIAGSTVLAGIAIFGIYGSMQKQSCTSDSRTILVLVDFTDNIGPDARRVIKDKVWSIIERAPDYSRVVFRQIVGETGVVSSDLPHTEEICRVEKPGIAAGGKGPTVQLKANWKGFKDRVCGKSSNENDDCGSAVRASEGSSFFDRQYPPSDSSPIIERIVDYTREYLTNVPHSWDLVIATDWKQYTSQLDLATQPCVPGNSIGLLRSVDSLIPRGTKIFSGPVDSGGKNTITSLFVLRQGMTNSQAQCLDDFGQAFLMSNVDVSSVAMPEFSWLPR